MVILSTGTSPDAGFHAIAGVMPGHAGILDHYRLLGESAGALGPMIVPPRTVGCGGGWMAAFDHGVIYSHRFTGTHHLFRGAILDAWGQAGGAGGLLGFPIASPSSAQGPGAPGDLRWAHFQGGTLLGDQGSVSRVPAAIREQWLDHIDVLGEPTGAVSESTLGFTRGEVRDLQTGEAAVIWGASWELLCAHRDEWGALLISKRTIPALGCWITRCEAQVLIETAQGEVTPLSRQVDGAEPEVRRHFSPPSGSRLGSAALSARAPSSRFTGCSIRLHRLPVRAWLRSLAVPSASLELW